MCNLSDGLIERTVEQERQKTVIGMLKEGIDYTVISRITTYPVERIKESAKQQHLI